MGDYAEMMLDGTHCEGCGQFMGQGDGLPRYCSDRCRPTTKADTKGQQCVSCGKSFRSDQGLLAHCKAKHHDAYTMAIFILTNSGDGDYD